MAKEARGPTSWSVYISRFLPWAKFGEASCYPHAYIYGFRSKQTTGTVHVCTWIPYTRLGGGRSPQARRKKRRRKKEKMLWTRRRTTAREKRGWRLSVSLGHAGVVSGSWPKLPLSGVHSVTSCCCALTSQLYVCRAPTVSRLGAAFQFHQSTPATPL